MTSTEVENDSGSKCHPVSSSARVEAVEFVKARLEGRSKSLILFPAPNLFVE